MLPAERLSWPVKHLSANLPLGLDLAESGGGGAARPPCWPSAASHESGEEVARRCLVGGGVLPAAISAFSSGFSSAFSSVSVSSSVSRGLTILGITEF